MKKTAFSALVLGALVGGFTSLPAADFCYQTPQPVFCEQPCCDNGKFSFGADYLFWQTKQDNQPAVALTTTTFTPGTTVVAGTSTQSVNTTFDAKSGGRVWLGYEFPCDQWGVEAIYTYVPGNGSTGTVIPLAATATTSQAITIPFAFTTDATSYSSKWNVNINNFDLDVSRKISCGNCFSLRPHIGFRALWIDETLHATAALTATEDFATAVGTGRIKEKFQGYGVEGGLWANWDLGYGVSLVGHVGGSILYSKFDVKLTSALIETTAAGVTSTPALVTATNNYHTGTPTVDYFVGLEYTDCYCDWTFSGHIGWEQHVVFELNQLINQGNLYTQGLTVGLNVGF